MKRQKTLLEKYLSLKKIDSENDLLKYGSLNKEGKFRLVNNNSLVLEFLERFSRDYQGANLSPKIIETKTIVSAIINYENALEREIEMLR